ncbi:MAG TPA: endolytic transglycosylase MltG [Baekduia sp.]|nr:endolytic transglycosylase MltG [Baekduia sp.]
MPGPRRGVPGPRRGARRAVALVLLLLVAVAGWFLVSLFQPFAGDGEGEVQVTVPQGADIGVVADVLAERGVVSSAFFFELRARVAGDAGSVRAGTFTLRRDMSYGAALDVVTKDPPPPPVVRVTIPEGRSRAEIAPLLAQSGLRGRYADASVARRAVLRRYGAPSATRTLEGFLFPATYELETGSSMRDLVAKQLDAFDAAARETRLRAGARRMDLSPYEVLIIASMIEREVLVPKERRMVSAVIHNRLEQGIPLGIDATIRYALRNWTRPLRQSELAADTPFNTRTRQGLPPTPIGNPGQASIAAALRPATSDALFYVVKPCGNGAHAFSATDAEFQRDVDAYNRAREARGGRDPSEC